MATAKGYRNYTDSGSYWTVRKRGATYWVVLIDNSNGTYVWSEVWGGYTSAGAAGGAAAQLAYAQGATDAVTRARAGLHSALDDIGLGVPKPSAPNVPASSAPKNLADQPDDE